MIDALIQARLLAAPQERVSKNGNVFVAGRVRVAGAASNDDSLVVNLLAFSEQARAALMEMGAGEGIAASGALKVGIWVDKAGATKVNVDMTVAQVLTPYAVSRRRAAQQPQEQDAGQPRAHLDRQRPADRRQPDHSGLDNHEPLDF